MEWLPAISVFVSVLVIVVRAHSWMNKELREKDRQIAELQSELRSLRENFEGNNALRNEQLEHIRTTITHQVERAQLSVRSHGTQLH